MPEKIVSLIPLIVLASGCLKVFKFIIVSHKSLVFNVHSVLLLDFLGLLVTI